MQFLNKLKTFNNNLGILKQISPTTLVEVLMRMVSEWKCYGRYKNIIRDIDKVNILESLRVRRVEDTLYHFVNLKPEMLLLTDEEREHDEKIIVANEVLKIENKLYDYNLFEMLKFKTERVKTDTYYGYGVQCDFNFMYVNRKNIVYSTVYFCCVVLLSSLCVFFV